MPRTFLRRFSFGHIFSKNVQSRVSCRFSFHRPSKTPFYHNSSHSTFIIFTLFFKMQFYTGKIRDLEVTMCLLSYCDNKSNRSINIGLLTPKVTPRYFKNYKTPPPPANVSLLIKIDKKKKKTVIRVNFTHEN